MRKVILIPILLCSILALAAQHGFKNGDLIVRGSLDSIDLLRFEKVGSLVLMKTPALVGTNINGLSFNIVASGGTGSGSGGSLRLRSAVSGASGATPHTLTTVLEALDGGIGFLGAAPTGKSPAIADASGGVVVDIQCRAAVNAVLAEMRSRGFVTP